MEKKTELQHCPQCGHRFIYRGLEQPHGKPPSLAVILMILTCLLTAVVFVYSAATGAF